MDDENATKPNIPSERLRIYPAMDAQLEGGEEEEEDDRPKDPFQL